MGGAATRAYDMGGTTYDAIFGGADAFARQDPYASTSSDPHGKSKLVDMVMTPTMTTSYWLPCFSSKPTLFGT
jgi:hypothetical protein